MSDVAKRQERSEEQKEQEKTRQKESEQVILSRESQNMKRWERITILNLARCVRKS